MNSVSLPAERHGADNGRIMRTVTAIAVVAFASFSGLARAIGEHVG